ncbi:MAG: ABC transporter permease subunit [Deltaproteobacteria bacterium]|nr:ABC transporter permease subunit [Deltaproteobacteria bacterium]
MTLLSPGRALLLVARHELLLAVRSRWTQIFAGTFAALSLGVAISGYVLSGGYGFQDFARTSASQVELLTLLVPLAALLMGVLSLSFEPGSSELLFSQPLSRPIILLGKLAGLFVALGAAEAVGFGLAGIVIFANAGDHGLGDYATLVGAGLALSAVFLALAAFVTVVVSGGRRVQGLAAAIVTWFVTTVLFDVAALGVASLLPSGIASRVLIVAVIVNPVAAVRTAALLSVVGTAAFGSASLAFLRFTGGGGIAALALCASVLFWIVVPAGLAARRLAKIDL